LADTDTISGISLPVAPVANSLAAFIASGGTALGTELADSKSLVDAIGTDGTTVADTATGIAGMIGVDDADNVMATTAVVANADGSVFERLEYIQQRQSFVTKSAVTSSSIPNNTQTAGAITGAATGDILAEEISFQCGATGWATPTNIEISSDNVRGPTGAAAPIFLEIIGSFGAASRAGIEDATSEEFPWLVESGKKLFIHGDDAAGTGGGICDVVIKWTPVTAGATIAGSDLP
ncbi:MAG: hypothetical protein Q8O94_01215, partial [bacterium]|nr:hypothetical protein [bacterium]